MLRYLYRHRFVPCGCTSGERPRSSVHWVTLSVGRMFRICSSFSATVESPQRVRERTSEGGSRVMVPSIFAWGHIVPAVAPHRSEEHTSELQSLMRISYAVFCLKKKNRTQKNTNSNH